MDLLISSATAAAGNTGTALQTALIATITSPSTPTESSSISSGIETLNSTLANAISWVGAVVIAFGILQLILSMSDGNPGTSSRASLTISGGICMLALSLIIDALAISETATVTDMVKNAIGVIGKGMTYTGAILAAIAIFQYILALAGQNGGETAQASRLLGTSVALLAGSLIADGIKGYITETSDKDGTFWANYVITEVVGPMATYIGAGFLIHAAVSVVMALRSEDTASWSRVGLEAMVGIALLFMTTILKGVLGIATTA